MGSDFLGVDQERGGIGLTQRGLSERSEESDNLLDADALARIIVEEICVIIISPQLPFSTLIA